MSVTIKQAKVLRQIVPRLEDRGAGQLEVSDSLALVIAIPTGGRPDDGARAFASIATVGIRRGPGPGAGTPTSVFYTRASAFPASGGGYDTALVPDGVTRVRWDFNAPFFGAGGRTVFVNVRDNLASAPASRYQGQIMHVTWYGPHNQVLKAVDGPSTVGTLVWRLPQHGTPLVAATPPNSPPLAQINLQPPAGTRHGAGGVLTVDRHAGILMLNLIARRLAPNTKNTRYAVWLTSSSRSKLLGFVNPPVRSDGVLKAQGVFPPHAQQFSRILITRETSSRPAKPGTIVLTGRLRFG